LRIKLVTFQKSAKVIVTDSVFMQKETFFHRVPCFTPKDQTDWVAMLWPRWEVFGGSDGRRDGCTVVRPVQLAKRDLSPYGLGDAVDRILDVLVSAN
jgi:UDP-GlcNAc3NAcA epimerase